MLYFCHFILVILTYLFFCSFVSLSFLFFLSRHHAERMSNGSKVSKVTLWVKSGSQWVSEWPRSGHYQAGQLKTNKQANSKRLDQSLESSWSCFYLNIYCGAVQALHWLQRLCYQIADKTDCQMYCWFSLFGLPIIKNITLTSFQNNSSHTLFLKC